MPDALHSILGDWPVVAAHRGCERRLAPAGGYAGLGEPLRDGRLSLLGLFGDRDARGGAVHVVLYEPAARRVAVVSERAVEQRVPSLGAHHPPAIRLERALRDLFGIEAVGLPDPRPWLDHGCWPVEAPLAPAPGPASARALRPKPTPGLPEFLPATGPALHQIPVGPVHAGIIEPGHFRFTAHGETVVRLEARLGYTHKGVERLLEGRGAADGARLAARVSGDSTVAYGWAYARAVELALGVEPPPRAAFLRAVMAELERVANHLGDVGAICNDAAFSLLHAEFGVLREWVLRAAAAAFGHRLMMDRVVPGGVAQDPSAAALDAVAKTLGRIAERLPELFELYDNTASLQDRTAGTGVLRPELAARFAAPGFVGRASGRSFDTRRDLPYPPYDALPPEVPVRSEGDVNARVLVRLLEVQESLRLLDRLHRELPGGAVSVALAAPAAAVEATALVEGFRGDVLVYLRLARGGSIERCHLRDPSWFQWPLLEAATLGNIVADFPLCNKSFNCSYSGHDL